MTTPKPPAKPPFERFVADEMSTGLGSSIRRKQQVTLASPTSHGDVPKHQQNLEQAKPRIPLAPAPAGAPKPPKREPKKK